MYHFDDDNKNSNEITYECSNDIDINIKSVYFFVKVVECGNISKAAGKLYVSQPYLSKTIKSLEERLGFSLFTREKNHLLVTSKGEEFYKTFRPLVLSVHENIVRIKNMDFPKINIAVQYTIDFLKLRNNGFISNNIDLKQYNIEYRDFSSILKGLNDDIIDSAVILSDYINNFLDFEYFSLGKIKSAIVVSPKNKLSKYDFVTISDIADEEFVFYLDGNRSIEVAFPMAERYCKKLGIEFPNISFAENYHTALLNVLTLNKVVIGEELLPTLPIPELVSVPLLDHHNELLVVLNNSLSAEKKRCIKEFYNKKEWNL